MSKGLSYIYTGTKGHIVAIASNLPQTGQGLIDMGWEEISHPAQRDLPGKIIFTFSIQMQLAQETCTLIRMEIR